MAFACVLALSACGLETATTAATVAGAKAQEAQQAKQQMDLMQAQIQAATDKSQAQQKALPD
jgi:hypothetical protein